MHTSNGIRTHDPSVQTKEDSSYLRPRGHCDWHIKFTGTESFMYTSFQNKAFPGNSSAALEGIQTIIVMTPGKLQNIDAN
jgi:hypothetical protein